MGMVLNNYEEKKIEYQDLAVQIRELKAQLHSSEAHCNSLQARLLRLTGCEEFGLCDGINGACVDCDYDHPELWAKCHDFKWNK